MRSILSSAVVLVISVLLVSCGGGGGDDAEIPQVTSLYEVGVVVSGLAGGSLVIQNNGSDSLSVATDGASVFSVKLPAGAGYAVDIETQPAGQTCAVTNGSGTIAGADITNISINCVANGTWVSPASAIASGATVWNGALNTGLPSFAIDGSKSTKWTYNGLGSITFDLGSSRSIKGVRASLEGSVSTGNNVNVYVDGAKVLSNQPFGATTNVRYFSSVTGRTITYETVALPHDATSIVATWSELAEFEAYVGDE